MKDEDVKKTDVSVDNPSNDQTSSGTPDPTRTESEPGEVESLISTKDLNQITAWCGDCVASTNPMEDRPLRDVLEWIRSNEGLKNTIEKLRTLDKESRQKEKMRLLPYFTLNTFRKNRKGKEHLISAKYCPIDFDGLSATKIAEIFKRIKTDEDVMFAFRSPSGDGLKLFVELKDEITDPEYYTEIYLGILKQFEKRYGVTADPSCQDCGRATFVSFDPDIYISEYHTVIPVVLYDREVNLDNGGKGVDRGKLIQYFRGQTKGGQGKKGRTDTICSMAGYLHYYGVPIDYALVAAEEQNKLNPEPLSPDKVESTVKYIYKKYQSRDNRSLREIMDSFYSLGPDVYQATVNSCFSLSKINVTKFNILTNAIDERDKARYLSHLVKEKHIPHLERIDDIGDMTTDRNYYEYRDGTFTVHFSPLKMELQDNEFIENWLGATFGQYRDFIKQWLTVYCYTNYKKLPTLVLKGDRGTGKNTFAEAVMSIFPAISRFWHGEEKNFTPEVQNKLLIADESVSANEKQYRMLKQRSGQKMAVVNQKFIPEYQVRNNMNIIILSNEHTPIFVQKDEEPTSEKNNQFFVYTMPAFKGEIDPDFGEKIEARLGHYIRTELTTVYESVKALTGCRYSIPTPITEEEKALFNVNQTGLEEEGMKFLRKMVGMEDKAYTKFFAAGLFPVSFFGEYTIAHGYTRNGVIRNLKEKGWLKVTDPVRKMVNNERQYCYEMTEKLKKWYEKEKSAQ